MILSILTFLTKTFLGLGKMSNIYANYVLSNCIGILYDLVYVGRHIKGWEAMDMRRELNGLTRGVG